MTFQLRATLAFTDSRPTIDPIAYDPEDPDQEEGGWARLRRTMWGERKGNHGRYLLEWEKASCETQKLAVLVDDLADERRWFEVQVLKGLYDIVGSFKDGPEPVVEKGVLVVLLMADGWNAKGRVKSVYIDWLNSALYASNPEALRTGINSSIKSCGTVAQRKGVEAYAINTAEGSSEALPVGPEFDPEPGPIVA